MKSCEQRGRDLLDLNVITTLDLTEWLRAKESGPETIGLGLPSYSLLCTVMQSIRAGSGGLLLGNGVEVNQFNRPQDRLLDWFFHPVLVLKEQIQALHMTEEEVRFLEKLTLFIGNPASASGWDNGATIPRDPVRTAQIQAISRRFAVVSYLLCFLFVSVTSVVTETIVSVNTLLLDCFGELPSLAIKNIDSNQFSCLTLRPLHLFVSVSDMKKRIRF
jgi:hypothetical protein